MMKILEIGKNQMLAGCRETDHLYIAGKNVKWYCHFENSLAIVKWKQKLNMQLTYNSETVHLGIYHR